MLFGSPGGGTAPDTAAGLQMLTDTLSRWAGGVEQDILNLRGNLVIASTRIEEVITVSRAELEQTTAQGKEVLEVIASEVRREFDSTRVADGRLRYSMEALLSSLQEKFGAMDAEGAARDARLRSELDAMVAQLQLRLSTAEPAPARSVAQAWAYPRLRNS